MKLRVAALLFVVLLVGAGCEGLGGLIGTPVDDTPGPIFDAGADAFDATLDPVRDAGSDAANDASSDAPTDAPACKTSAPWGTPVPLTELNSTFDEWSPRLTSDELTIFFSSSRGDAGNADLYIATRATRTAPFGQPSVITGPSTPGTEVHPSVTGDGLTIYYQGKAGPSLPQDRIYRASRPNAFSGFGSGAIVPELVPPDAGSYDLSPFISSDGTTLFFASTRRAAVPDFDLYQARMLDGGVFEAPTLLANVNDTPARDETPVLSPDLLTLYFASWRLNSVTGNMDIFVAKRGAQSDPFGAPALVTELATPSYEAPGWVSPDGCRLYFMSNRAGGTGNIDLWIAAKP